MKKTFALVALAALLNLTLPPAAVDAQGNAAPPAQAEAHRAEASNPVHFDTSSRPLREMVENRVAPPARGGRDFKPGHPLPVTNTNPAGVDPLSMGSVRQSVADVSPRASTVGTGIDPNYRVAPPDTTGDVGPNHYVQWVNLRYSVYTLTRDANNQITGFNLVGGFPKNGNVIWQGFGGPCETYNDGDPIVQYDQFADRWVLTQFAVSAQPYTQCVAVSTGPDPTGTYHRYAYSYGKDFNDYPKMGVWRDGYYITYNMFRSGRSFVGNRVCALERDKMLLGQSARQVCAQTSSSYASLMPADIEGKTLPAAGSPNPLLHIGTSAMGYWKFAVNWANGTGTLTGPVTIPGVSFSRACGGGTCIPQAGTSRTLDSLGDRLMYRLSYRNLGTREALVVNHSVATNNVTGIRWYELTNAAGQTVTSATPVVRQQGTYAPTAEYRWMGSAAMDKTGGIAIGYNVSSSTIKPGIRYTYRAPADPLGTMGIEQSVLAGPGSQTGTLSRWGDYSTLSVDPVDDCTMVFTTEYIPSDGSFNWATYIHSFRLSTCQ
ncbi:MAG TPA: hypothetical protein VEY09_04140 [Pyrinomonadaceae bacterium]|nr:hypothetical protein [Pyrinomonadaceae bacterium]